MINIHKVDILSLISKYIRFQHTNFCTKLLNIQTQIHYISTHVNLHGYTHKYIVLCPLCLHFAQLSCQTSRVRVQCNTYVRGR
ncbi:hypothetical protein M6B38_128805 [Iris pallida]|uniref:Uncharacterized protein n=1 Tax=Iris pallida TaxID=29817 RepID=A0AAX6G5P0_IRIPA|nr:hypothetical protein M6B38_128805 [Iris pallida]